MAWVYVLECSDKSYYVGSSRSYRSRIKAHKSGEVRYTKSRLPVLLIFLKQFQTYNEAYLFEQKIKSWKKRESIERMLNKPDNLADPSMLDRA